MVKNGQQYDQFDIEKISASNQLEQQGLELSLSEKVELPAPASAENALNQKPTVSSKLNYPILIISSLIAVNFFFLAIAGFSNLMKLDTSLGYGLALFVGVLGCYGFSIGTYRALVATINNVNFRNNLKDPKLLPLILLAVPSSSNFYTGAWYAAEMQLNLNFILAEMIGVMGMLLRTYIIARSPQLIRNELSKWKQAFIQVNKKEIALILISLSIGALGSIASLDSYYNVLSHPLVKYAGVDQDNLSLKAASLIWSIAAALNLTSYYGYWIYFNFVNIIPKIKTKEEKLDKYKLCASLILCALFFGAPLIGSATSPNSPILATMFGEQGTVIFKIIATSLMNEISSLISATKIYDQLSELSVGTINKLSEIKGKSSFCFQKNRIADQEGAATVTQSQSAPERA